MSSCCSEAERQGRQCAARCMSGYWLSLEAETMSSLRQKQCVYQWLLLESETETMRKSGYFSESEAETMRGNKRLFLESARSRRTMRVREVVLRV
ncbi:hypothetical protein RRG08_021071 [Elysia crispata]|uniref:Uncharacterized protein n=1 Tax=Elysia crispata TaxID=231223 RepID=A0AAE1D6W5_9GAST|nr:hypothetical protein RRG08_021071 [Elysia crispata]